MSETFFHHLQNDKVTGNEEICIEYTITALRPATYWEPAEGGEVEILKAWIEPSGKDHIISDEEYEKWSETIAEQHDHSGSGDYFEH